MNKLAQHDSGQPANQAEALSARRPNLRSRPNPPHRHALRLANYDEKLAEWGKTFGVLSEQILKGPLLNLPAENR